MSKQENSIVDLQHVAYQEYIPIAYSRFAKEYMAYVKHLVCGTAKQTENYVSAVGKS